MDKTKLFTDNESVFNPGFYKIISMIENENLNIELELKKKDISDSGYLMQ